MYNSSIDCFPGGGGGTAGDSLRCCSVVDVLLELVRPCLGARTNKGLVMMGAGATLLLLLLLVVRLDFTFSKFGFISFISQ